MSKPKVYVTRRVHAEGLELLLEKCELLIWNDDEVVPRSTLLEQVKGASGIFCTISDKIDSELLDAAGDQLKVVATMSVGTDHVDTRACRGRGVFVAATPNMTSYSGTSENRNQTCDQLKVVATMSVGTDHVDTRACRGRGVFVAATPDMASDSAAELSVALVLITMRRIAEGLTAIKTGTSGHWKPMWLLGNNSMGKTVGIFGFGRVGFGIARRMKPFGIDRVIYSDIEDISFAHGVAERVSFDKLLEESDILCITCAVTPQTRKLFDKKVFSKMKKSAVLINSSRGVVVNQEDLYDALKSNMIGAAGLDVTDPEPLPLDHPLMNLPNCVILPHMGTNTFEARRVMSINTAKNILAMLD